MRIKETMRKVKKGMAATGASVILMTHTVMAAPGLDEVTKPITNVQTLLTTIAAAIGGAWLAWSLIQFAFAFNQNDSAGKQSALKGIVAGGILLASGTVLTFVMS